MAAVTICSGFGEQEMKFVTASTFSPSICHEVMGLEWVNLTQMTITSTTAGKNPSEEMDRIGQFHQKFCI